MTTIPCCFGRRSGVGRNEAIRIYLKFMAVVLIAIALIITPFKTVKAEVPIEATPTKVQPTLPKKMQRLPKKQTAKIASASAKPRQEPSTQPIIVAKTGSKTEWMKAAGIPETDWYYVDCVIDGCEGVNAEGGWGGTQRWNTTGSGAYGLCQALPASKMASAGDDYMTNPITQLKWCNSYAQGYGGWKQAWQFRKCLGRCYSQRASMYVDKSHTWW